MIKDVEGFAEIAKYQIFPRYDLSALDHKYKLHHQQHQLFPRNGFFKVK